MPLPLSQRLQILDQRSLPGGRKMGPELMAAVAFARLRSVVEERAFVAQPDTLDIEFSGAGPKRRWPLRGRRHSSASSPPLSL